MRKRIGLLIIISVMLVQACGCNKQIPSPINVAIVSGYHANSPIPNWTAVVPYIEEACASYGFVSIIVNDGAPFQTAQVDIPAINKDLTADKLEKIKNEQVKQILTLGLNSPAVSPEVDTLKGIECGIRSLSAQTTGEKWLVILDSGISTTGELNFVGSYFQNINSNDIAKKLKDSGALPDCTGFNIVWFGIGDTSHKQPELCSQDKAVLKEVWQAVLTKAGAASVTFATDLPMNSEVNGENLPEVSVVEVLERKSAIEKYDPEEMFVLDERVLNFKPGTAELLTPIQEVEKTLQPIKEYLLAHPDYEILLAGTTASFGSEKELKKLSEDRCNTVKEILLDSGVDEKQIHILGLGYENIFSVKDTDEDGNEITEQSAKNRTVRIINFDSETATNLLNGT